MESIERVRPFYRQLLKLGTLLALTGALATAALAQAGGDPEKEGKLSPVTISGGKRAEPTIWTGDRQKFSVFASVAPENEIQSIELVVSHARAGEKVEQTDVRKLTRDQLEGKTPIEWVVPFAMDGLYTAYFRAQGVGSPTVVRYPRSGFLTFKVQNWWQMVAAAAGLTVFWFFLVKLGIFTLLSKWARNQTRVAPASLFLFLAMVIPTWLLLLNLLTLWPVVGITSAFVLIGVILAALG